MINYIFDILLSELLMMNNQSALEIFDRNIWVNIFKYIGPGEIPYFRQVCSSFNSMVFDSEYWEIKQDHIVGFFANKGYINKARFSNFMDLSCEINLGYEISSFVSNLCENDYHDYPVNLGILYVLDRHNYRPNNEFWIELDLIDYYGSHHTIRRTHYKHYNKFYDEVTINGIELNDENIRIYRWVQSQVIIFNELYQMVAQDNVINLNYLKFHGSPIFELLLHHRIYHNWFIQRQINKTDLTQVSNILVIINKISIFKYIQDLANHYWSFVFQPDAHIFFNIDCCIDVTHPRSTDVFIKYQANNNIDIPYLRECFGMMLTLAFITALGVPVVVYNKSHQFDYRIRRVLQKSSLCHRQWIINTHSFTDLVAEKMWYVGFKRNTNRYIYQYDQDWIQKKVLDHVNYVGSYYIDLIMRFIAGYTTKPEDGQNHLIIVTNEYLDHETNKNKVNYVELDFNLGTYIFYSNVIQN